MQVIWDWYLGDGGRLVRKRSSDGGTVLEAASVSDLLEVRYLFEAASTPPPPPHQALADSGFLGTLRLQRSLPPPSSAQGRTTKHPLNPQILDQHMQSTIEQIPLEIND